MMTKSFKMQSKRIALCTVLLLGMALPAYASKVPFEAPQEDRLKPYQAYGQPLGNEYGQESDDNKSSRNPLSWIKNNPWKFAWRLATLMAVILALVAIFSATLYGEGGNSLLWQITGASLLGAFAIGGAIHYYTVKREYHITDNGKEWGVVLNQKEDGSVSMYERARKSKSFWFSLWCVAIATVCVVFISMHFNGAGNFDFGGPDQGVNLKALLPLLFGALSFSFIGIGTSIWYASKHAPPSAPVEQHDNMVTVVNLPSRDSDSFPNLMQVDPTLIRRRLTTLQLVLRDLEETH